MNSEYHTKTIKMKLRDGTIKKYTYQVKHVSQKKETFFDKLMNYEEVKNIIKNECVRNPDKLNFIVKFVEDIPEFKGITLPQIQNFVYRITNKLNIKPIKEKKKVVIVAKQKNYFDILMSYDEVVNMLKNDEVNTVDKINFIIDFTHGKDEFEGLTITQIKNFVYRIIKKMKI